MGSYGPFAKPEEILWYSPTMHKHPIEGSFQTVCCSDHTLWSLPENEKYSTLDDLQDQIPLTLFQIFWDEFLDVLMLFKLCVDCANASSYLIQKLG